MAEQLEFLSDQYLATLARALEVRAEAVQAEVGDRSFTFCHAYSGVPPHLASGGELAWHVTFAGGRARFGLGEPANADLLFRLDYATTLPFARLVVDGDAARQAELQRLVGEAMAAGKFVVAAGDLADLPAAVDSLRDDLARVTA